MEQQTPFQLIWEFIATIGKSLIFAAAIIMFIGQVTVVEGHSMEPTLHDHQRLVMDKISYEFYEPARGDVVIIEIPSSDKALIKRVIGLEGETVEVRDSQVYVDGVLLAEPYQPNRPLSPHPPTTVPAEHIFVMGDNRPNSRDSRAFGTVDIYRVVGKARFSIWPPDTFGIVR